ncbi:hypothetical protein B0H17DRAFT_1214049 [Mycena rosella]|uniref:Uncharacterized protein n=1 Tax=Mycena rosella TaxID=1033263 RepID=A0AAD7G4U5_MYCRO|nr:hypothetical protein B0H17DRAFT_1214049 [Mycena rosella]
MFLEIATEMGNAADHKTTWLLLELHPRLGDCLDIFRDLTIALEEPTDVDTLANISDTFRDIRNLLGPDFHPFFVLDEAQFATDSLPAAFHPDPGASPVLVEILNIWDSHHPIGSASFVVAGTEIPGKIFEQPKITEHLRWASDTGAFDEKIDIGEEFTRRAWHWTRGR